MNSQKARIKARLLVEPNLAAFLTLFSFGTLARAFQFLVPLIIYATFQPTKKLDFYFYWSTQSNLIANFISAIWPSALMSLIVKARTRYDISTAQQLSALMIRKFFFCVAVLAFITALLATRRLLGGPISEEINLNILWGLTLTITCTAMAIALSEIATAQRKFGLIYQGLLASAVIQIFVILILKVKYTLELSFLLGSITQLIFGLYLTHRTKDYAAKFRIFEYLRIKYSEIAKEKFNRLQPSKRIIFLLYIGGFFTLATSHLSFRLLGDTPVGAISAFAMASMLALAPQQLLIQHLSSIAGLAMTESFHKSRHDFVRVSTNWRNRLFLTSLLLGLSVAILALLALKLLPKFNLGQGSWLMAASMLGFLSLPLAISGLNTWLARMNVSIEKFETGVWYQVITNSFTIGLLFLCAKNPMPFSTPLALAISALFQLISIPIYYRLLKLK